MSTDGVEQENFHSIDLWWIKLASIAAMVFFSLLVLVWMIPGRRAGSGHSPQPEEEGMIASDEAVEGAIPIPPYSGDQRVIYLSRVAEMFYVTMTGQHDEHEVRRRFRGGEIPSDAVRETVYQLQLLTQALIDGHYQVAAEMLELVNMDDVSEHQIRTTIQRQKDTYPDTTRGSFNDIGYWLYTKHGNYLRSVGRDLVEIEDRLGIAHPEPDAEDELDPDGFIEVESAQDRLIRYMAMPLEECSDPELWQELHHWGESDSDDM